ncbi:MAG: aspartate carbamoyltransferase [Candidatus Kerfeldbacteria bacterium]|nr:aspartate carbamoyltransferase [Candidatus Kerfeldbacteria bacterium]
MYTHILSTNDFTSRQEIEVMVKAGQSMVKHALARTYSTKFPDKKAVLAFFEPSTRTHKSHKQAALNLGMRIDEFSGAEGTSLMKHESLADTARMIAGQGADILVLRATQEGSARWVAEVIEQYGHQVTVINGGDGRNQHPTQTLLDLLTILEKKGRLDDLHIGLVGDLANGRTAVSLIQALKHFDNIRVTLVAPKGAEMLPQYKAGINIVCESESMEALRDCDVIYVTRFQLERITDPILRQSVQGKYVFNKKFLDSCQPDVIVMHPLPSVEEIAADIKHDPRMVAFEQAEYGIPARMAVFVRALLDPFQGLGQWSPDRDLLSESREFPIAADMKPVKFFQPINHGTVIDHIPSGEAINVIRILESISCITDELPRQLVQHVHTRKYEGQKDVLLLPDIMLDPISAATVQYIFPEITVNEFPGNNIKVKRTYKVPSHVEGIFRCPNDSCITNREPEAISRFRIINRSMTHSSARCIYCERDFTHYQLLMCLAA